jgi:4-amino-4-deoxy-L-arabinose transferase-like glycosyltransferase
LTVAWQAYVLGNFPEWRRWLLPVILTGAASGGLGLLAASRSRHRQATFPWPKLCAALALLSLLVGPVAWSLIPLQTKGDGMMPVADPSILTGAPRGVPLPGRPAFELDEDGVKRLSHFLLVNRHGEPILMAAVESFLAAPLIIEEDLPVIALGGFSGSDRVVSTAQFARMVAEGQIRFVLIVPGHSRANSELLNWIRATGRRVESGLWGLEQSEEQRGPEAANGMRAEHGGTSQTADGAQTVYALARKETKLYDLSPRLSVVIPATRH